MSNTMNQKMYNLVKNAFIEGWNSYETQCCAFNNPESAWENSEAKFFADKLLKGKQQ